MSRIVGSLAVLGIATGGPWMVWAGVSCTVYPDEGCFQDFTDGYYRVLRNGPYEIDGGVTIEKCLQLCVASGYALSGVEDGTQCFCDDALQEPVTPAENPDECLAMPCAGDENESCGDANRLRAFATNIGACFQDFTDGSYRALRIGPYELDGGVTIEKCMQLCYGFGFSLSGVEDGAQCFCDNALQEPITPVDDQIECLAEPCAGNEYEYCGGANRLRVFNVSCNGKSAPNWWGCLDDTSRSFAYCDATLDAEDRVAGALAQCG